MCWLCLAQTGLGDSAATGTPARDVGRWTADSPQPTAPRFHLTASGDPAVDALQSGFAWAANDPVSFAFPDSAADYEWGYGNSEPTRGFAPIGATMQAAIRDILLGNAAGAGFGSPGPHVTGFTNLAIVESATDSNADIRIARSSAPSTAWAYYPNGREGGDVWFGNRHNFDSPRLGSYQFLVAVHEIGHALGLKHPHESSNGFGAMEAAWDSLEFSVMSYRSRVGLPVNTGYTNAAFDYPQGWMMLDIAALQALYGADYGLRAGNTTYSWSATTGETLIDGIGQGLPGDGAAAANRVFLTIWDGSGNDTYDFSNFSGGVVVDLSPGGHSITARAQLATLDTRDGTLARGNVFNALLHQGNTASLIENALGGAGADTLSGNQAANWLSGGAGNDMLAGRAGSDLLDGGAGADTLRGGTGDDRFVVDQAGDVAIEVAGEGVDTLVVQTAAAITLPSEVEILLLGLAGRNGIGQDGANLLRGNAAANRLEGRGGNDVLEGRGGNDTLLGGAGADSFVFRRGDGFDRIEDFTSGTDRLVLTGFGVTAAEALAAATEVAAGLRLDFGGGDGVLLAGLRLAGFGAADLVL
jgi:serralysin